MKLFLILLLSFPIFAEVEAYVSPKKAWDGFNIEKEETPLWESILLYLPNRLLDLWDIFKLDVGVGPAWGANVRITKYAQGGFRFMAPGSLRVGNLGRRAPIMIESSNEFGVSPLYVNSRDRTLCTTEIGAGIEPFIGGIYVGICPDQIIDFIGGIFLLDLAKDDM